MLFKFFFLPQQEVILNDKRYPMNIHHLSGRKSFAAFCSLIQDKYSHLLDSSNVYNLCLVFEENRDSSFFTKNSTRQLDKMGKLSHERWKEIAKLHVILPSANQFYQVAHGRTSHYQATFHDILNSLLAYKASGLQVNIYFPYRNYANGFISIWNQGLLEESSSIPWKELG